jgi:hypothetical protein
MHLTSIYLVLAAMAPLFFVRPIFSLFLHRKKRKTGRALLFVFYLISDGAHTKENNPPPSLTDGI